MPRQARYIIAEQPYHVIQRGNNRQNIFHSNRDRFFYLDKLHQCSVEYDCAIHCYTLMSNHTHFIITPKYQDSLAKMMLKLGAYYVPYFNKMYQRTGGLWEGRYRSSQITSENYFFICMRYIELNPVRAGIVKDPYQYRWTSYHHNALGIKDPMITEHYLYQQLGNIHNRASNYKELFKSQLTQNDIRIIQKATQSGKAL